MEGATQTGGKQKIKENALKPVYPRHTRKKEKNWDSGPEKRNQARGKRQSTFIAGEREGKPSDR